MIINPPGRTTSGMFGPSGQTNGFGRWWEPDMYPVWDLLDDHPTAAEVVALRNARNALPINTYEEFDVTLTGGICNALQLKGYKLSVVKTTHTFNNVTYNHISLVRHPAYGSTPPVGDEYPIILKLHGRTDNEITVGGITGMDYLLHRDGYTDFYPDQCVVVFPAFFGFSLRLPSLYRLACRQLVGPNGGDYGYFDDELFETDDPEDPTFKTNYQADGYTSDDVQIMAVLQSLKAIMSNESDLGVDFNGDVGIIGTSMGANMAYKIAPVMHASTGTPWTLKACAAFFGSTDQYAPSVVRREKRWLASAVQESVEGVGNEMELVNKFTYDDITINQKSRMQTAGVIEYLKGVDPAYSPPPNLKADLRYWFLEDSVARYFQYASGPFPFMILHGTYDRVVSVRSSRWLASYMRHHEVDFDDDHFTYHETNRGTHDEDSLSDASLASLSEMLSDTMGY